MKKHIISTIALMAVMFAGCSKQEMESSSLNVKGMVFTAVIDGAKTTLDGKKLSWSRTDEIAISDGATSAVFEILKIEDDVATFVAKAGQPVLSPAATKYTAYYPASLASGNLSGMKVSNAAETGTLLPMAAVSKNAKLQFRNLCAAVKFSVAASVDGYKVNHMSITADKALSGAFSIADDGAVVESTGDVSMSLECQEGFGIGKTPIEVYMYVPAGEYQKFDIRLSTTSGATKIFPLVNAPVKIQRNRIYTKSLYAEDLDVCDFREEGPANCYVATAPGKYRFATEKRDGTVLQDVASVKLVWTCVNSNVAPLEGQVIKSLSYKDGVVDFETDDTRGNALIAAYDSDGKVLWSWHIWYPDERPSDLTVGGGVVMDRYLGALCTTPGSIQAVGCMYQYGRKDPFPGRGENSNNLAKWYGATYKEQAGPVDMETAIQNPTVRYYGTDSNFWTTPAARDQADWDTKGKSLQDPCPRGYMVPSNKLFGVSDKASLAKLFTWDGSNYGLRFDDGKVQAWYPATGQLAPKGVNLNSGTSISFSYARNKNTNGNPLLLDLRNNAINGWEGGAAAAAGFAVRCEKINE